VSELVEKLQTFQPKQGESPDTLLERMAPRSRQVHFHEAYHFWQGLRLPFLFRYATLSFRQAFMAFKSLAEQENDFLKWDCVLPEFERLGIDERVGLGDTGHLFWGREKADFPAEVAYEVRISPLDLLECATSIAEFQVTATGDKTDPVILSRWAKRNPAYLKPYQLASRFLNNQSLTLRAILPLINAAFHTSEPVRTFVELLGRLWGTFVPDGSFAKAFLAQKEPCRWSELFEMFLSELPYEAKENVDGKILGSPYHRIGLDQWVGSSLSSEDGGFLFHPFIGLPARKWIEDQKTNPEYGLLMDHPNYVRPETFRSCLNEFSPPLTIFRFHLGNGRDQVFSTGEANATGFTSLPLRSASEWRAFVADALTIYGAVRRASGAHFDAEQRTCHHAQCPYYEANYCNLYPIVPNDFRSCGFPKRIQELINTWRGGDGYVNS
jgi:hypothetical protein